MIQAPQSSPALCRLPACALAISVLAVTSLAAQTRVELSGETPLRRGIGGVVLGSLSEGAAVTRGQVQGGWAEVTLTGWIVGGSVGPNTRDGFDVAVTANGGENLRESPNGKVLGRLQKGTLLRKLGARGGWVRVKRTGWVPRRFAVAGPVETAALAPRQNPAPRQTPTGRPATSTPPGGAQRASTPAPASDATEIRVEVARAASLEATPNGSELGTLQPGAGGRILGRAGGWVRVQFEGWMREGDLKPATEGALVGVSAAEVRANPQRYVGQTVEWRVQFIAVQTADELRAELPAGQPFLLTRGPLPEPGFVYVIVPRDQLPPFQSLAALQELLLRVTIRAPRTKYLATPVVELESVVSGLPAK